MADPSAPSSRPVAVITGSSRGLGREIALRFAREDWNIVVNCVRSTEQAESVAAEIRSLGADALVVAADVAEPAARERLVNAPLERWGRLDCLVNNAGIMHEAPLVRLTEAEWDRVMAVDLLAPISLGRCAAQVMRPGSSIVNVASISGLWGVAGAAAYCAAKGALIGFTTGSAAGLAQRGVRINAVLPGYLATDMGRAAPDALDRARARHAMSVLSDPRAAAELIVRLASLRSISGQVFVLDGRIR